MKNLKKILRDMDSVVLAYSGGVDSVFLLKVVRDVLRDKVIAVTGNSSTYPREELVFAKKVARGLGVKHIVLKTQELNDKNFRSNPIDRCYFCKKELFSKLKKIAKKRKIQWVIDASNVTDLDDLRPGRRAKEAYGVRSPLEEAGFSKDDIRRASKNFGLVTWDKPAQACLASRIPYLTEITENILLQVNSAERYIRSLGFPDVRVRSHGELCRIEVNPADIKELIACKDNIVKKLKNTGYRYVTVDLQGYRMGSMNELIPSKK